MESKASQIEMNLMLYPRSRWHRLLFVSPVYLWRAGFGPLLGRVLLVLSHRGRKSGQTYHTMIEYHKLAGTIYAPSAFGSRSDWYKNITADPLVSIQTADKAQTMIATRVTDDDEILRVFRLFLRRDPPLTTLYLKSLNIQVDDKDILRNKDKIHWIRFDPANGSAPEPLDADLAWLWIPFMAMMVFFVIGRFWRQKKNESEQ